MRLLTNGNKEYPPKVLLPRSSTSSLNMASKMPNAPNIIIVYDDKTVFVNTDNKTLVNHTKQSKRKIS